MRKRIATLVLGFIVMSSATACSASVASNEATVPTGETAEIVSVDNRKAAAAGDQKISEVANDGVFEFDVPKTAVNVDYRYFNNGIAELTYDDQQAHWTYRIKNTDELTDISGLTYKWDVEDEARIGSDEGKLYAYSEAEEGSDDLDDVFMVQLVNWYDAKTGVTHSLSASGSNINGLDLEAMAQNVLVAGPTIELEVPDSAESVYYTVSADGVVELTYIMNGSNWTHRTKVTDDLEDISGKHYKWDEEEKTDVNGQDAVWYSYASDDGDAGFINNAFAVQVINWYDPTTGMTHSLSVSGMNTDGLDLQAFAETL